MKTPRKDAFDIDLLSETLLKKGLYYAMWRQQIGERKKVAGLVAA